MNRPRDTASADLFYDAPKLPSLIPGSMDFRATVAHLLADMLKAGEGDRYAIAGRASRLAGKEITKYMLDAYTAESREEFNLPAWSLPAIETACGSHAITAWMASVCGGRFLIGRDALAAELGRIERDREELHERALVLKAQLKRMK